ncbi:MAG TPA: hypothetical protein VLM89_09565 [Phycisphaerae bacterium]|nr:hypothetical protein [Phycisphaerae bacterium]
MSKRDMIDRIRRFNPTAQPEFLADFDEPDLLAYLGQLTELEREQARHAEREPALQATG